jgi:hypothetical protein
MPGQCEDDCLWQHDGAKQPIARWVSACGADRGATVDIGDAGWQGAVVNAYPVSNVDTDNRDDGSYKRQVTNYHRESITDGARAGSIIKLQEEKTTAVVKGEA